MSLLAHLVALYEHMYLKYLWFNILSAVVHLKKKEAEKAVKLKQVLKIKPDHLK